jgi:hypothetical protein
MRASFILAAVAASFAGGCGPSSLSGPADDRLAAFIPADTVVLAGVRLDELKKTSLYQEVLRLLGSVEREGFDPRRDIQELLIASDGNNTVAMARGRFQRDELARMEQFQHQGVTLYGDERGAVAVMDDATAVAGTTPAVRAAIDQQKSGRRAAADLLAKARTLPTPNQVWMVSKGSASFLRAPRMQSGELIQKMLNSLSDVTFFADFRDGIYANASARAANAADAKFIGDTVRGLVGLGRLSVPRSEPSLTKAFDGVTVQQSDRSLSINAKVPGAVAAQAMERLRSFSREPRPRMPNPHPR